MALHFLRSCTFRGVNFQQMHVGRNSVLPDLPWPVDRRLPLHHQPSTCFHIIAIALLSTCPCHLSFMCIYDCMWNPTVRLLINRFLSYLSLPLLITAPITSTRRHLLSSVLGCLSGKHHTSPHIHLIILIYVLSIFDSSSAFIDNTILICGKIKYFHQDLITIIR